MRRCELIIARLAACALLFCADAAFAQSTGPAPGRLQSVRATTEYDRSDFWRLIFGEDWRDVWAARIEAPLLDLGSFAGGLEPFKRGGNQTRTLRFHGADGRTYIFRSINKNIDQTLSQDLKGTPIGTVIEDQTAALHPTGQFVVAVLQQAVGLLYAPPRLVYMPDDPRLGKFRDDFANTLGAIEERPDEAEKGRTFADAEKIIGTDKLLEKLEESMEDRFDSRDYLTARFIDFLIGDTDRGADQWRWAKLEAGERDIYRPIPRDRDYAFMKVDGFLMGRAAHVYPKLTRYSRSFPPLASLTFMTQEFDRSQLVDLPWATWDSIIAFIQQRLSDEVIDRAVAQLPPAHRALSGARIVEGLRARRDGLRSIAREYYRTINEDAEVFASDEDERAEIDRNADGSVRVRVWRQGAGGEFATDGLYPPAFDRRFTPDETAEIRLHLERGNDRAVVRGSAQHSIRIRVVGGEGDDVLIDSSRVAHAGQTHFYDASGHNTIVRGVNTHVSVMPYIALVPRRSLDEEENAEPEAHPRVLSEERRGRFQDLTNSKEDFIERKTQAQGERDWGQHSGWAPLLDYRESAGLVVGFGSVVTDYGFRRKPYESRIDVRGMAGLGTIDFGVQLAASRFFEQSPWSVSVFAHATQLESNRFFGYGNDTKHVAASLSLVRRDELLVRPTLTYALGTTGTLAIGPIARYVRPHVVRGSPADSTAPLGTRDFGEIGARADFSLDRSTSTVLRTRGFDIRFGGSAYPALWDAKDAFGEAHALLQVFVPVGRPDLALRMGGQRVWGTFPLHDAAFIGGASTLRGFTFNRFAGDAAVFGSAELRVPVGRVKLLTRGELGVLALTDAGRVWLAGASRGDWHTSGGGGVWFSSLGQVATVTYAKGEEGRVYFSFGFPF